MDELIQALTATGYSFAQYAWSQAPEGDYGTYGLYSERSLWADGRAKELGLIGVVDYYTRDSSQTPRLVIEAAFGAADVSWSLDSVQFESDSGLLHYVWTIEAPEQEAEDDG